MEVVAVVKSPPPLDVAVEELLEVEDGVGFWSAETVCDKLVSVVAGAFEVEVGVVLFAGEACEVLLNVALVELDGPAMPDFLLQK